jgi:PAS domain S-box-containing protein
MNSTVARIIICLLIFFGNEMLYAQGKKLSQQQENTVAEYKNRINQYQKSNNKVEAAEYLNKLAYIYWESEHYIEAIDFFTQSLEINKALDNKNALKSIYNSLGMIYSDLGKYDKALDVLNENLKLCRKLRQKTDIVSALVNLSIVYENLKRYNDAISSLDEALKIAQEENNIKLMRRCYSALAENYEHLGKNDKSMEYTNLYISLDKVLQKEENNLKDQKINQIQSYTNHIETALTTKGKMLEETEASLKEVQQLVREKQMENDLLQKDKLIQSLEIRQQKAQLKFERQLLETQNELQAEQEKKSRFKSTVIQFLIGGLCIISALALIIYTLYRKLQEKEKRLLESEEKFRKLFEDSEDVLLLFDNLKIIDCNHACWKFLGFSTKEQLINTGLEALLPPEQPDQSNSYQKATTMLDKAYQVGYARHELIIKKIDNSLAYVDVSHTAIKIVGKKVLYSIWRDIDKQKKAENELNRYKQHLEELVKNRTADLEKAKIKAEESDKLKSVFLSNMSHEIKTPLNAIIGISKMMLKNHSESLAPEQKESIKVIHDAGNRLFRLLDDILEYSEILAGNTVLTMINIHTEALKQQINQIATDAIGDKPIQFSISVAREFPETFNSDSVKLIQILTNLIDNAAKFTDTGSIHLSVSKDTDKAIFLVSDTGQGINKTDIPKLFQGFKQLDDSASRKYSGTGLGLAICKEFIDLLGGSISIESEPNKGTCVHFGIPI